MCIRDRLAADGDDGHARTARGGNLGHAAAGQKAHAGGVDDLAGAHDGLAGARLLEMCIRDRAPGACR